LFLIEPGIPGSLMAIAIPSLERLEKELFDDEKRCGD
jgi:hypothetical protein